MKRIGSPRERGSRWRFKNETTLEWTVPAVLFKASGDVLDLTTTLGYRKSDPLAVALTFSYPGVNCQPNRWVVGRELLETGLEACSGEGCVCVFRASSTETAVELTSQSGHALILFETETLRLFLKASHRIVPSGDESRHLDIGSWIAKLLGGAQTH